MNIGKLTIAINEAERFLIKAHEARKKWDKDLAEAHERINITHHDRFNNVSAENATCKRASMDLTRALANLRKP